MIKNEKDLKQFEAKEGVNSPDKIIPKLIELEVLISSKMARLVQKKAEAYLAL